MRTTVDIPELILRQTRSRAALEGRKMQDVVNEALCLFLNTTTSATEAERTRPQKESIAQLGRFKIPMIRSTAPSTQNVSVRQLKQSESEEDEQRHAAFIGR